MILVFAGGVGGAKLTYGLANILPYDDVTVVVNTGDDFVHLGLRISPDLDTVMYTLAGINNTKTGWGIRAETWNMMTALERLGGETWFRLGDYDLATHLVRTQRLQEGHTLSDVTEELSQALGVRQRITPMTDQLVETILHTDEGILSFQHYFVRRRCVPRVHSIEFVGAADAFPSVTFTAALLDCRLQAIVICPSNPYLSIQPVLSIKGIRDTLADLPVPVVAVSPLIGGAAVKGPAAKIMQELGVVPSNKGIAHFYRGVIDGLVIDECDRRDRSYIEALGLRVCVTATLMSDVADQVRLARNTLDFAADIAPTLSRRRSNALLPHRLTPQQ